MKKYLIICLVLSMLMLAACKDIKVWDSCSDGIESIKRMKDDQIEKRHQLIRYLIKENNITLPKCVFARENMNESNYCLSGDDLLFHCEPEYNPEIQTGYSCETIFEIK